MKLSEHNLNKQMRTIFFAITEAETNPWIWQAPALGPVTLFSLYCLDLFRKTVDVCLWCYNFRRTSGDSHGITSDDFFLPTLQSMSL